MREDSIADLGLGHPQIRRMLGELGKRLVTGGAIACADDVYWLEAREVDTLASLLETDEPLQNHSADVAESQSQMGGNAAHHSAKHFASENLDVQILRKQ